jgi:TonB family protein
MWPQLRRPARRARAVLALVLASAAAAATSLQAQGAARTGTVRDRAGRAIAGAQVGLAGDTVAGVTGPDGTFRLAPVPAGPGTLRVRRVGYRPLALRVTAAAGAPPVAVTLQRAAQTLDPVVVRGERNRYHGRLAEFYRRRDAGLGHHITREQIDRRNPFRLTDLLRTIPGVDVAPNPLGSKTVRMRGARCDPLVWLDGYPMSTGYLDPDFFSPRSIEAMEIYSGVATIPQSLLGAGRLGACGVIVIWSRTEDQPEGRRRRKAELELVGEEQPADVFLVTQVDTPARLDAQHPVAPVYPNELLAEGRGGEVVVDFVVDTTGLVDPASMLVVSSSESVFADAVRLALTFARFHPAELGGRLVRQVVRLPVRFLEPEPGGATASRP